MPAKLDRCVKKVSKDLKDRGLDPKEAESRAWAICTKSIKDAKEKKEDKNKS